MKYLPAEAYQRYGLDERATPADFIAARYQDGTRGHAADPLQWEQMFAVCEFSGDDLAALRLYPIDLGHQRPRSGRGRPMLAEEVMANRILAGVARLSAKYATRIEGQNGVGVVQV
jgi:poly-gamma-glutamate synthesis protein (capsule biosynthesis protein)